MSLVNFFPNFALLNSKNKSEFWQIITTYEETITRREPGLNFENKSMKIAIGFTPSKETLSCVEEFFFKHSWRKVNYEKEGLCNFIILFF